MGAIAAATRAVDVLRRNPVILVGALLVSFISLPSYGVQLTGQQALSFVWSGIAFFITPFLTGGLLGMADEGLRGSTELSTFVSAGKENYVTLLLVALLLVVIIGGVSLLGGLLVGVVSVFAIGVSAAGGFDAGLGGIAVVGVLVLVYALVVLGLSFIFQFTYQAVVVDDVGAVDALKQSYRTVRNNVVGALGVGAIALVASAVLTGPVVLTSMAVQPGTPFSFPLSRTAALVVLFGWGAIGSMLLGAFNNTMLVAFYDEYAPRPVA